MNCLCMVYQTYTVKLEVRQMYGFYTDRILGLTFRVCWVSLTQQTKNRDTEFWRTTAKHRYFGTTMVYIQKLNWI